MTGKEYVFYSVEETQLFAEKLAAQTIAGKVIALIGDLGTGKTTFTKGFARGMGIKDTVASPTFKLVSEYMGNSFSLYHIDCYRLKNEEDFLNIDGERFLFPQDGITIIEWADRIQNLLSKDVVTISFSRISENESTRKLVLEGNIF